MSFGKILKAARKENEYTQAKLGELLGYGSTTISEYEKGNNNPNLETFINICKILKHTPNYFLQNDIDIKEELLNPKDKQLIDKYHNLTPNNKSIVDYILEIEDERADSVQEEIVIYKFPVYEQEVAAGAGITGRDGKFIMYNIFTSDIPNNAVFGVHIKGESMINTDSSLKIEDIPNNSIVLLNPKVNESDLDNTIVVASINNEVICKQFLIEQNGIHFYSLNREEHADDDRFAKSHDDYRIIGQVVKVIKPTEYE